MRSITPFMPPTALFVIATGIARPDDTIRFDSKQALAGWTIRGAAAIDPDRSHHGGGSLRLGPGSRAIRLFRATNDSGRVDMWVNEDLKSPKVRARG